MSFTFELVLSINPYKTVKIGTDNKKTWAEAKQDLQDILDKEMPEVKELNVNEIKKVGLKI